MAHDPRVDAYIAKAAVFAQPILTHLRTVVGSASPDISETIKWSMPFFDYRGKPLANMAAFKAHAAFGFWRREGAGPETEQADAMGQFGKLSSLADLPDDAVLTAMVHTAMELIDVDAKTRRPARLLKPDIEMPDDLRSALEAAPAAAAHFEAFPPSARREYLEWVVEAKAPATRAKRIATTVEQCSEGKRRNWKYENC